MFARLCSSDLVVSAPRPGPPESGALLQSPDSRRYACPPERSQSGTRLVEVHDGLQAMALGGGHWWLELLASGRAEEVRRSGFRRRLLRSRAAERRWPFRRAPGLRPLRQARPQRRDVEGGLGRRCHQQRWPLGLTASA
jgi:hypothetical protein